MFTVEVALDEKDLSRTAVEFYLNEEGLDMLLERLSLLKNRKTDHLHLMTESWGLGDLSEDKQGEGNTLVHHLKITRL